MCASRLIVTTAVLGMTAWLPAAAQPSASEAWTLEGFSTPESAVFDGSRNVIYISNVAGQPLEKNGAGFISRVSPDGEMLEREWVTGLDAPKGLVIDGATLYVSDIDRLVAIDIEAGEIAGSWTGEGAHFLNDTAVDAEGRVYVSDMAQHRIYRLESDAFAVWLEDEALEHPNGLKVDNGRLLVAAWGPDMQQDFTTREPGQILVVDLETQEIEPLGAGDRIGNLDGLEPEGNGNWLTTDWIAGGLFRVQSDGSFEQLIDLDQGSADLGFIAEERLAIIPMMMDDRVVAYRLE
jgi:hypothetical protein